MDPSWRERAACKGMDPAIWYPTMGGSNKRAKEVCDACPVKSECGEAALARREDFGIWGGMSERERRRILRRRNGAHPEMRRAPRPRKQAG